MGGGEHSGQAELSTLAPPEGPSVKGNSCFLTRRICFLQLIAPAST